MNRPPAAEERKSLPEKDKLNNPGLSGQFSQPRKRRVGAFWIVVICVVTLVAAIWWVNHQHAAAEASPFANMRRNGGGGGGGRHGGFGNFGPLPVIATPAEHSDLHVYLNGLGTVTALSNITVRTQISGQLTQVLFSEGQLVKKGDLLATIDSRPYQVALEQAQGNLLQAQAQLRSAQGDLERYQTLAKQDSIAQQQVDTEAALVSQYQGLVQADQAAIDNAKLNITYCHIVAPVDGRVGLRQVDAGNYVTPGDSTGLVVLTEVNPITVIYTLPEDNVPRVAARLRSGAEIPVEAYDRSMTTLLASGKLATIDNQVDVTTGTFKLRALFKNDRDTLFPNQFVNIRMLLDTEQNDIVIPTSAVERGQDGTYVYVVTKDDSAAADGTPGSTVAVRTITLGSQEGERVAVSNGLKPGDLVVSDGADKLKDGAAVIVQVPAKPGSTPGQGNAQGQRRRRNGTGGPGSSGGNGPGAGAPGGWHRSQDGGGGQGSGAQGSQGGSGKPASTNSGGSQQ